MSEYVKKTWENGEVIDADKLNNIETGISEAKKDAEQSAVSAKKAQETAEKHASRHAAGGSDPITPAAIGAYNLGRGTAISSGANLDELTVFGAYYSATAAISASLTNSPLTNSGFRMIVERGYGSDHIIQRAVAATNGREFIRVRTTSALTWSKWAETATADYAMGFNRILTASDDLNDIVEIGIYLYYTSSIPANCPYKNAGVIEVIATNSTTSRLIQRVTRYGAKGQMAFRWLDEGKWMDWTEIATADAFLRLTGGDLTGNLNIQKSEPKVQLESTDKSGVIGSVYTTTAALQMEIRDDGTNNNRRRIYIPTHSEESTLQGSIMFADHIDGVAKYYQIYGTHNIVADQTDYTAGSTALATGAIHLRYE